MFNTALTTYICCSKLNVVVVGVLYLIGFIVLNKTIADFWPLTTPVYNTSIIVGLTYELQFPVEGEDQSKAETGG